MVSGVQLLKEGYKSILDPTDMSLTISKDSIIKATGKYCAISDLIKFDENLCNNTTIPKFGNIEWHTKFGHQNMQSIKKTLQSVGIPTSNRFDVLTCEDCVIEKSKQADVPFSRNWSNYQLV